MALVSTNQHGALYVFGLDDSTAPTISGFKVKSAEITYEPEVMATTVDGEGHVDAVAISKPGKRKWTGRFTGHILTSFNPSTLAEFFQWEGRKWFIKPITVPKNAGQFAEVTIEAESYANVA